MAIPIQTFRAPDLTTRPDLSGVPLCAAILDNLNLAPGADVIVIRRTHTQPLAAGDVAVLNQVYIQTSPSASELQLGTGAAITAVSKADGVTLATLVKNDLSAANIWRYRVHVYFVGPCSIGSGAGGVCVGGDPQVPTLKRLELGLDAGGALAMNMVPLVEGIELIKAELGIDNLPTTVNAQTFMPGDSMIDSYTATPAITDLDDAISVKLFVLARNAEISPGHNDTKTYLLGSAAPVTFTAPANNRFKRHVFTGETILANLAGRKEIPQ
jgi:type IV pilus assembly protein PilW